MLQAYNSTFSILLSFVHFATLISKRFVIFQSYWHLMLTDPAAGVLENLRVQMIGPEILGVNVTLNY